MRKVHWVNPTGSILVPVAVMTRGNLSFVRLSLSESKVLRLIQLMEAPVSYSAFIFTLLQLMEKLYLLKVPRLLCKYLQSVCPCYLHPCSNCRVRTASLVNPEDWGPEHLPGDITKMFIHFHGLYEFVLGVTVVFCSLSHYLQCS